MGLFDFLKRKKSPPARQPAPAPAKPVQAPKAEPFRLEVSNKYSAYGGFYAEGKMQEGALRVGEAVASVGEKAATFPASASVLTAAPVTALSVALCFFDSLCAAAVWA